MNRAGPPKPVRVLQIGAGGFGRHHLAIWSKLSIAGEVALAGVVVKSEESRMLLAAESAVPVFTSLDEVDFSAIDAVDIVTPAATHASLVRRCLPHADVLVEKPLALSPEEAVAVADLGKRHGRRLMVGHTYRFHPVVDALRALVSEIGLPPTVVYGALLNPAREVPSDPDPTLELLHWFDVLDLLFEQQPEIVWSMRAASTAQVSLRYPGPFNVNFRLGWAGEERVRTLDFIFPGRSIQCDFIDSSIILDEGGGMRKLLFPQDTALEATLRGFVQAITANKHVPVDAETGARIVAIADAARPRPRRSKPRVAVIGGGIFGATCAAELGSFCDVTLFERHGDLLTEASNLNQWRYHHGFHYPRSVEMIREIKECRTEFESVYGGAVEEGVVSYYATAKSARIITRDRYLHVCSSMGLEFEQASPPAGVLDETRVSVCLATCESVFRTSKLREVVHSRIATRPDVRLVFHAEVVEGRLLPDGRKRLVFVENGRREIDDFDYVINATYANRNMLSAWFGFPLQPLRFDLLELLVVELPLPKLSMTVLDGPFTSLVSMGEPGRFSLSHIQQSVLMSATPPNGLPPDWRPPVSNRANLLRHASQYMPILSEARVIDSRFGTRTVHAHAEDIDGRPTVVTDHGFGCWSILGGKVNTSVSNARQIAGVIAAQHGVADDILSDAARTEVATEGEDWRDRIPMGARRR
jgi:predicted dehydrogenase